MTADDEVEHLTLLYYNRIRVMRKMKPVDHIGANNTPEVNSIRDDVSFLLSEYKKLVNDR